MACPGPALTAAFLDATFGVFYTMMILEPVPVMSRPVVITHYFAAGEGI